MNAEDFVVVLVTAGSVEEAERLARTLVEERLVGCANVVGPIRSIYRWQGAVCRDDEHLLLIKTTPARYPELEARVLALHTYENPEVIAVPVEKGAAGYVEWILKSVTGRE